MLVTKTNNSARSFWHMKADEFHLGLARGVQLSAAF